jgi:hypothetical protein
MAKNFQEPEETKSQTTEAHIIPDQDMLTEEEVIDRVHAQEKGSGPTVQEWSPPDFDPKEFDKEEEEDQDPADHPLANDDLKEVTDDEKQIAGRDMARGGFELIDMVIREVGNHFLTFKMRKLQKMERAGEINLGTRLYYPSGASETAEQAIGRYNQSAYDVLALSEEYKEKGSIALGPEFAKRGIGLTKLQYFGFVETGKEVKRLAKRFAGMYGIKNDILDALREQTANPNPSFTPPPAPGAHMHTAQPSASSAQNHAGQNDQGAAFQEPGEEIRVENQEAIPADEIITHQPQEEVTTGTTVEDIQEQRGAGVIVEDYMPQHLKPVNKQSGSKRNRKKAFAKKK